MPNTTAGMIIGKGGAFINEIKQTSGSYVQISQKSKQLSLPERCVTVAGRSVFSIRVSDFLLPIVGQVNWIKIKMLCVLSLKKWLKISSPVPVLIFCTRLPLVRWRQRILQISICCNALMRRIAASKRCCGTERLRQFSCTCFGGGVVERDDHYYIGESAQDVASERFF